MQSNVKRAGTESKRKIRKLGNFVSQLVRLILIPAILGALLGLGFVLVDTIGDDRPGYAKAVDAAAPAVVNITTQTRRRSLCDHPAMRPFCQGIGPRTRSSLGSGVIVRKDGYVLTNAHVIQGADQIRVMFANGQDAGASIVGTDSRTDLAVIKVDADQLPVIPYDPEYQARVGDVALAIGNPFGLGHSVSQGIVSALSRSRINNTPWVDYIQTDAAISPGNSGGALINHDGQLLGINTLVYRESNGGNVGIGFAIPADIAMEIMTQIIDHGRVIRGWLGVTLRLPVRLPNGQVALIVDQVVAGGPAHKAGLKPNDAILTVNQIPISDEEQAANIIAGAVPGTELQLEILRGQQRFRATAITEELPYN